MLYTFRCTEHGDFDRQVPMADRNSIQRCALCQGIAPRRTVYHQSFKMEGQTMPPNDGEHDIDVYDELGKTMKRRGYGGKDEAIQDIRDNMVTDKATGDRSLNRAGMKKAL